MGKEIERKFLVKSSEYRQLTEGSEYKQGYLSTNTNTTVRIRQCNGKGIITIKGIQVGLTRAEYEYEIPFEDSEELLDTLCAKPIIEKVRYKYRYEGFLWEIDEFKGNNEGLVIAEIELEEENTEFSLPEWIGEEVTYDFKYHNSNLVKHPYKDWAHDS